MSRRPAAWRRQRTECAPTGSESPIPRSSTTSYGDGSGRRTTGPDTTGIAQGTSASTSVAISLPAVDATEVLRVLAVLDAAGVRAGLTGGWGVDALLRRQTRLHGDVDLGVPAEAVNAAIDALAGI